jgi:hypothetical protein
MGMLACLVATIALIACSGAQDDPTVSVTAGLPPVPSLPAQSAEPGQPPVIWVGGTITDLRADRITLREESGSELTLRRLGRDATAFFRVSRGSWRRVASGDGIDSGEPACVETLMDRTNLLALRVFLGARCGPA